MRLVMTAVQRERGLLFAVVVAPMISAAGAAGFLVAGVDAVAAVLALAFGPLAAWRRARTYGLMRREAVALVATSVLALAAACVLLAIVVIPLWYGTVMQDFS
jgi:hypothetical protein